ncbi:MAG: DUF2249 domain-containing protein [Sphingobacteriales bacterium]
MIINANTKIAELLKQHPDALETIVSISRKFTKLRNPLLRKVIARRASIAMASKLGGCSVDDFLNKLQPLGFEIDKAAIITDKNDEKKPVPEFLKNIQPGKIIDLDVRPVIETGKDPLSIILQKVKILETGYVLKIINSFEPTPLMHLLGKQGFVSHAENISDELVHTYFYKKTDKPLVFESNATTYSEGWDEILNRFNSKLVTVDVRELKMPLPMHTILEALETLPEDKALFVYHKRIPVFLLPELEERKFIYRIREISDAEVHLLIYKD